MDWKFPTDVWQGMLVYESTQVPGQLAAWMPVAAKPRMARTEAKKTFMAVTRWA